MPVDATLTRWRAVALLVIILLATPVVSSCAGPTSTSTEAEASLDAELADANDVAEAEAVSDAIQELYDEGYADGRDAGEGAGQEAGHDAGYSDAESGDERGTRHDSTPNDSGYAYSPERDEDAYLEGYEEAFTEAFRSSYDDAYDVGYDEALEYHRAPEIENPNDLDCSDVSGPVEVGPDDPNNLDADGDGIGCDG